jgi:hypothetical protein
MKKILALALVAIFASTFANASTGMGGKTHCRAAVKTTKTHFSKISVKSFSIKKMQDTKDILMPLGTPSIADFLTNTAS